jgi:hypothetical protein
MFKNPKLELIINAMPAKKEKLDLTMLFVLIDGYLNKSINEEDFLNDISIILNVSDEKESNT